MSGAVDVT